MAVAYINIGSNLGEKRNLISLALEKISEEFGVCCVSEFYESKPWGFESDNRFLNLGVSFNTRLHPEILLDRLQRIERSIGHIPHRDPEGNYRDRDIDIDIMAIDEIYYHSDRLDIPHLHLLEREFFILPLKELCPEWNYPYKF